ncbi:MAG: YqaE/Pmp3 family membrane protein [Sediminibacterium sp.]|nr:YqaE/Pmp3 family membrane protein [Sediminibacterium sp.]
MGVFRAIISLIFPPLSVFDKGCGAILLVSILTLCGWLPGVIAAIIFNKK